MTDSTTPPAEQIVREMRRGSQDALAVIFDHYRERLKRIIQFRLDYRIASRISDSDVLQETFLAAAKRLEHFRQSEDMTPFLWLRLLAGQELTDLHRRHLQAEMRDARKEVSLQARGGTAQTSLAIAVHLVGNMTSVSEVLARAERIERLESNLNQMDTVDREVIALRHFEELTNTEVAEVLGIKPAAASKRYVRAMSRLAEMMTDYMASQEGA